LCVSSNWASCSCSSLLDGSSRDSLVGNRGVGILRSGSYSPATPSLPISAPILFVCIGSKRYCFKRSSLSPWQGRRYRHGCPRCHRGQGCRSEDRHAARKRIGYHLSSVLHRMRSVNLLSTGVCMDRNHADSRAARYRTLERTTTAHRSASGVKPSNILRPDATTYQNQSSKVQNMLFTPEDSSVVPRSKSSMGMLGIAYWC